MIGNLLELFAPALLSAGLVGVIGAIACSLILDACHDADELAETLAVLDEIRTQTSPDADHIGELRRARAATTIDVLSRELVTA